MAGSFFQKREEKNIQIEELGIEALGRDFQNAYDPIKPIVNPKWEIVGEIPSDKELFFGQLEVAQKQKLLLEIALAKKDVLEREKAEANQYFEFLGASAQSLAIILRLNDFTMPPAPQGQSYYGSCTIFSRLMRVNFLKGNIYFDVAAFRSPRQLSGPGAVVGIDPYTAQIVTCLGDLLGDIERQEKDINEWLATLPKLKKTTQSYLDQAGIQQSILSAQYSSSYLQKLKGSELVAYRNQLEKISDITCERQSVLNVLESFSNLIDKIAEQIQKDTMMW